MNNSWSDRLKQVESVPPEKGWDKIAASLDESFTGRAFPITLYNLEAEPPAGAWKSIQDTLDQEIRAMETPVRRVYFPTKLIRYTVAACLLGLIVFAGIKFFSVSRPEGSVAVEQPAAAPTGNGADKQADTDNKTAFSDPDKDAGISDKGRPGLARPDLPGRSLSSRASARLYRSPALLASSITDDMGLEKTPEIQYSHRAAVNDAPADQTTSRYLMFKDSEGRFIKISKKLTSLFCCVSGEEQDDNCNDQLKKWREKIASSSFIPSPDNFMDILDLVNSLQDNRN